MVSNVGSLERAWQTSFTISSKENRLEMNSFAKVIESVGVKDGLKVQNDLILHKAWGLMPAGMVLLVTYPSLTEGRRGLGKMEWMDISAKDWQIYEKGEFRRILEPIKLAGAVLVAPRLTELDASWLKADIKAIGQKLPEHKGSIFVVEVKQEQNQLLDKSWRERCFRDSGVDLVQAAVAVNEGGKQRDYLLWSARRKKENLTFKEAMKIFWLRRQEAEKMGITIFESLDGGLLIVKKDWRSTLSSQVGEVTSEELLKQISYESAVDLSEYPEPVRRLAMKIERAVFEEMIDSQKELLIPGTTELKEFCFRVHNHPDGDGVYILRDCVLCDFGKRKQEIEVTDHCPHCGILGEPYKVRVKPHKRKLETGEIVRGWVYR